MSLCFCNELLCSTQDIIEIISLFCVWYGDLQQLFNVSIYFIICVDVVKNLILVVVRDCKNFLPDWKIVNAPVIND